MRNERKCENINSLGEKGTLLWSKGKRRSVSGPRSISNNYLEQPERPRIPRIRFICFYLTAAAESGAIRNKLKRVRSVTSADPARNDFRNAGNTGPVQWNTRATLSLSLSFSLFARYKSSRDVCRLRGEL